MTVTKALVIGGMLLATPAAHAASFGSIVDKNGKTWISISGDIEVGDSDRFGYFVRTTIPRTAWIVGVTLDSAGGNVREAERFALVTRNPKMRLQTYVADNRICASACFLIWAAGTYRQASPTSHIGVHSISNYDGEETLLTMALTTNQARELIMDRVSPAVIGKLVSTPPGGATWLTAKDCEGMGVEIVASKGALIPSFAQLTATTPSPTPPPTARPMDGATQAFTQGRADRQAYEIWIASLLKGRDTKDGALYWGALYWESVRSTPKAKLGCTAPGYMATSGPQWANGCQMAKNMLDPTDYRRTHDNNYLAGWNSIP